MLHRRLLVAGAAALTLLLSSAPLLAQQARGHDQATSTDESTAGHSHHMAMRHGGEVTMTPHHHFETLFTDDGPRLYLYGADQQPILDPKAVAVQITLTDNHDTSHTMDLRYRGPDSAKGRTQGYFYADHDMNPKSAENMKAIFRVMGLEKDPIEFSTPIDIGDESMYVCPMGDTSPTEDPGRCPKCGMEMKREDSGNHMGSNEHGHMEGMMGDDHDHDDHHH
ncbi:MAG: heavy metal-binding domain-containing protein [Candidatus Eisenbacteria bacterium]